MDSKYTLTRQMNPVILAQVYVPDLHIYIFIYLDIYMFILNWFFLKLS